jgi:hypothetical protein
MNKPYNIQNTNICNGIFHISFFKALLINEGETTRGKTTQGVNRIRGETTPLLRWYKTKILLFLFGFFVKVSLEIFDKSRPKLMNYYFFCM